MKEKLNTLRTLPEDKALAIFERYMREQWQDGFDTGIKQWQNTQTAIDSLLPKSIATLQKEAMNSGASNLPTGFND